MIKSNHAKELKRWPKRVKNDVTHANAVSERETSFKNLTFSALLCEQMSNEKERQTMIQFSSIQFKFFEL